MTERNLTNNMNACWLVLSVIRCDFCVLYFNFFYNSEKKSI